MNFRQFSTETRGQRGTVAAEALVADDRPPGRDPFDAAHHEERPAEDRRIIARPERFRYVDAGGECDAQQRELLGPRVTGGNRRRRVRANDAVPRDAVDDEVGAQRLLDRTASQRFEAFDPHLRRPGLCGDPAPPRQLVHHAQKSARSLRNALASNMRCTSEAPSTKRACRA